MTIKDVDDILLEAQEQEQEQSPGSDDGDNPNNNSWDGSAFNGDDEALDLADELIKKYNLKTVSVDKEIYYFDSKKGVYLAHGNVLIESELESRYVDGLRNGDADTLSKKSIDELIGHIQRRTYIDISALNAQKEWLACKDCMLNLVTGETAAFDPKYLNTTQIPVKYHLSASIRTPVVDFWYYCVQDPVIDNCPCPAIMEFLNGVMAPEDVDIVLDFIAYCLWREYKFHKWILFVGAGQNGKSTLLNLIDRFLGPANVSGESLDRLLTERFSPANLYQKLANVDADLPGDLLLRNTGKLKKLTGNDEFPGEFKYKPAFKFRNHAKLIFSCNEIPETPDKTDAFFRRLIIINFTQQFFGDKEDRNLIDKLTTEEELSGLLYELLRRLPRVLSEGITPTTNKTMADTYEKYIRGSDPTKYYVEKCIKRGENNISKDDVYSSYSWFCRAKKLPVESEQSFSRKLKELGFTYRLFRAKGKDTREYCWENVEVTDWKILEDKEQEILDGIGELTDEERETMK